MEDDDDYSSGILSFCMHLRINQGLSWSSKRIFRHHTKGKLDPTISGAEWWTLVVDPDDGE